MNSNRIAKLIIGGLFIAFGVHMFFGTNNTEDTSLEAYDEMELIMRDALVTDELTDGDVVALSGKVNNEDSATDELTGLRTRTAYLKRKVEMYQWVRDCGESGNDCKYKKEWSEEKYESDSYDELHQNPEWKYENDDFFASDAKIGRYKISDVILKELPTESVTEDLRGEEVNNEWKFRDGYYYKYESSATVGDLRFRYEKNEDVEVSVLAMIDEGELVPFKASNGKEVFVIHAGKHDAADLIKMAHNKTHLSNVVMVLLCGALIIAGLLFVTNAFKKG